MLIIGIAGAAGSGKDTAADLFVKEFSFIKISFADEMKRICARLFPLMTREHLWGPSSKRNEVIEAYPRQHGPWVDIQGSKFCACCNTEWDFNDYSSCHLTARYALQRLGTEWGRDCYPNAWVDLTIRTATTLLSASDHSFYYSAVEGLWEGENQRRVGGVVIPDVRWPLGNEGQSILKAGGLLMRMMRGKGLDGAKGKHESEAASSNTPDSAFDYNIDNRGMTLEQLEDHLRGIASKGFACAHGKRHGVLCGFCIGTDS